MEDSPRGKRHKADEALFLQPNEDRTIVPDRVGPAVEAYFRVPPVWIGSQPAHELVATLNPSVHHAVVARHQLKCGIIACAQRDGTFLFDFSAWPLAPIALIPGYRIPTLEVGHYPAFEHVQGDALAEARGVIRAQVMNAHQVCLASAQWQMRGRGPPVGYPITASESEKSLQLGNGRAYHDDVDNLHALSRNYCNNKDNVPGRRSTSRSVIDVDVVYRSYEMLDLLLDTGDLSLIRLVEGGYLAGCRQRELRHGEAVVLAWTVCEQLISALWKGAIDATRLEAPDRINKERCSKLLGRDYTASMMIETLELMGKLDSKLYRMLDVARQARNQWAHKMKVPKEKEVFFCIKAIEILFLQFAGISIYLQSSSNASVPQWPVWIWNQVKANKGRA